jgi:hypothetical protein
MEGRGISLEDSLSQKSGLKNCSCLVSSGDYEFHAAFNFLFIVEELAFADAVSVSVNEADLLSCAVQNGAI